MPSIYACYRRSDNPHVVGRVVGDLRSCFGPQSVFYDTDSIQIGDEWPSHLKKALAACKVLLVFVGKEWHKSWDDEVGPRLWHRSDWVRREICEGLDSPTKTVVPILIDDAEMPRAKSLPDDCSLPKLTEIQWARIRHQDYDTDITKLIARVGTAANVDEKVEEWKGFFQLKIHQTLDRILWKS